MSLKDKIKFFESGGKPNFVRNSLRKDSPVLRKVPNELENLEKDYLQDFEDLNKLKKKQIKLKHYL